MLDVATENDAVECVVCAVDRSASAIDLYLVRTNPLVQLEAVVRSICWWRDGPNSHLTVCLWTNSSSEAVNIEDIQEKAMQLHDDTRIKMNIIEHSCSDENDMMTVEEMEHELLRLFRHQQALKTIQGALGDIYSRVLVALYKAMEKSELVGDVRFEGTLSVSVREATTAISYTRMNPAAKTLLGASPRRNRSVAELLGSACCTKYGRACLRGWLDHPAFNAGIINMRQDIVSHLMDQFALSKSNNCPTNVIAFLSQLFYHFQAHERNLRLFVSPDYHELMKTTTDVTLQDFRELRNWIDHLAKLLTTHMNEHGYSSECMIFEECYLRPLRTLCEHKLARFCRWIDESMEQSVKTYSKNDRVMSLNEANVTCLNELRDLIALCERNVQKLARETAEFLKLPLQRVKTLYGDDTSGIAFGSQVVFRVSRSDSHRVHRHSGKSVTILRASKASGIWFTTPALDNVSTNWTALKKTYRQTEKIVVNQLRTLLLEERASTALCHVVQMCAELDILMAFSIISFERNFVRAKISSSEVKTDEKKTLRIINIFDPFEEPKCTSLTSCNVALSAENGTTCLLLDGETAKNDLRLIGLIVLMNQIGCFVPCQEAELPLFDAIFLRTGSFDQQVFGNSTFMTEMREMSKIIANMTSWSLVLIDDLCRGTSPGNTSQDDLLAVMWITCQNYRLFLSVAEGFALAVSFCEHFIDSKALTCIATQWRELTNALRRHPLLGTHISSVHDYRFNHSSDNDDQRRLDRLLEDGDLPSELSRLIQDEFTAITQSESTNN